MTTLFTYFEPFAGRKRNLSGLAYEAFEAPRHGVVSACLPVAYRTVGRRVERVLERFRPSLVIMTGEHRMARKILVERVALNVAHARLADNKGQRAELAEVQHEGPLALETSIDPRALVRVLRRHGLAAAVSHHAGTFLCNAAYYHALAWCRRQSPETRVLFLHLPGRPVRKGRRLADHLARALELSLRVLTGA